MVKEYLFGTLAREIFAILSLHIIYLTSKDKMFSIMASKQINIHWIGTGSQPYCKIMHSIVLHTIFHEYIKIKIIVLIPVLSARDLKKLILMIYFSYQYRPKAVNNTRR